jgi:hypothetical protein
MLGRENVIQAEECVHGVGHALAVVADDINDAYTGCATFGLVTSGDDRFRQDATQKCNKGVTMEWTKRFEQQIRYPSTICDDTILPSALGDCVDVAYSEELIRHPDRVADAGCERFAPSLRLSCLNGIGTAMARYASTSTDPMPYFRHPLCSTDVTCLRALTVGYIIERGTDNGVEAICARTELPDDCLEAVGMARDLNRSLAD